METEAISAVAREVSPAVIAGSIAAVLLAFSRKAPLMTKFWGMLPHPWPIVIPALVALLPQLIDVMNQDVSTWGGLALSLFTAVSIAAPGFEAARPKDKEDAGGGKPPGTIARDGTVIPPGPLTDDTPPPPPGIRFTWKHPAWMALVLGCSSSNAATHPACTPEQHSKEKLAYQREVHLYCAPYDVVDECPSYLELKSNFEKKIDRGCQ